MGTGQGAVSRGVERGRPGTGGLPAVLFGRDPDDSVIPQSAGVQEERRGFGRGDAVRRGDMVESGLSGMYQKTKRADQVIGGCQGDARVI